MSRAEFFEGADPGVLCWFEGWHVPERVRGRSYRCVRCGVPLVLGDDFSDGERAHYSMAEALALSRERVMVGKRNAAMLNRLLRRGRAWKRYGRGAG